MKTQDKEITLRQQFKIDHPETVGETDNCFDNSNYIDWLEKQLTDKKDNEKELLEKVFEAGKDKEYSREWQNDKAPDFKTWYNQLKNQKANV